MKCKICTHPERGVIEELIVSDTPRKELLEKYNINRTNIFYHKLHMTEEVLKEQHIPECQVWAFDPAIGANRWFKKSDSIPQILEPGHISMTPEQKEAQKILRSKRDALPPEQRYRYEDYI